MTPPVNLGPDISELKPSMISLRRTLHQNPELAFEETFTAATLAEHMRAAGLAVEEGIGGTGVIAILEGAGAGKTLILRADIDGMPLEEVPGREYGSRIEGRNHACGHDANSAIVASVADVLARHRQSFAGRIAFIFQPADEPMRGAQRMIDDGFLEHLDPDMSIAIHVMPPFETGQAVIQSGPLLASRDALLLEVSDQGGSLKSGPGVDAAHLAARLVTALYDMVGKEGDSDEKVTFRVGSLKAESGVPGGPNQAEIECNLAVFDNALRTRLLGLMRDVSFEIVEAGGGELSVKTDYALPALVNDEKVTGIIEAAAAPIIGRENIIRGLRYPFADDFSLFMTNAPGCFMLLGTANAEKGLTAALHTSEFDVDEDALPVGVQIVAQAALDLLNQTEHR